MSDATKYGHPEPEVKKPGLYEDPTNGDLWELSRGKKWRWINGNNWNHIPEGLVYVGKSYAEFLREE